MDKNLYSQQTVQVQKKSGFDKSYQNLFTGTTGTIIPIMVDELMPNSTVNLNAAITAQLPPLASDTFMRCKLKYASFFVPTRILVAGYERWLTNSDANDTSIPNNKRICLPTLELTQGLSSEQRVNVAGPGTLADFLGFKATKAGLSSTAYNATTKVSMLPFLAYHKIYNDWFRNSLVQKDIFYNSANAGDHKYSVANSTFVSPVQGAAEDGYCHVVARSQKAMFRDSVDITSLRQANFDIDLFTAAAPDAQNGSGQSVGINLDLDSETGDFTISALRAANSMQQFLERNNIAGNRIVDYVKAHFGANLSDAVAQRPILLGSGDFDVYSKGIYANGMAPHESEYSSPNPYAAVVGGRVGSATADGKSHLASFTTQEPGYLMVVCWLSPKVTYSTGLNPVLNRYLSSNSISDMADPILQNVGNEPIYASYFNGKLMADGSRKSYIFGYGDRYCTWKDKVDEVHGELRDGQTLESFALQRTIDDVNSSTLSTTFLQIPKEYLNQVTTVADNVGKFSYWCDTYFDYKVSMPLARYSVPSLQDPAAEHGETVAVSKGGKQLA